MSGTLIDCRKVGYVWLWVVTVLRDGKVIGSAMGADIVSVLAVAREKAEKCTPSFTF